MIFSKSNMGRPHIANAYFAKVAGIALLVMAVTAIFAFAVVFKQLVVLEDAAATFSNVSNALGLFIAGIIAWLVILVTDVIVAWALYYYFKRVNNRLSGISSSLRMVYALVLGLAIYFQITAAQLVASSQSQPLPSKIALQSDVLQRLVTFEHLWSFGLIVFGMHLLVLSLLALKHGAIPKWLTALLFIAGLSYMLIHGMYAFLPAYDVYTAKAESILSLPMAIAELGLAVWLIRKGGKSLFDSAQ